jgi:hypothetical protein
MNLECIKGIADKDNIAVVCMQGDIVEVVETSEGDILVRGVSGWCSEFELTFTPKELVEYFKIKRF